MGSPFVAGVKGLLPAVPILHSLTARGEEVDEVVGLEVARPTTICPSRCVLGVLLASLACTLASRRRWTVRLGQERDLARKLTGNRREPPHRRVTSTRESRRRRPSSTFYGCLLSTRGRSLVARRSSKPYTVFPTTGWIVPLTCAYRDCGESLATILKSHDASNPFAAWVTPLDRIMTRLFIRFYVGVILILFGAWGLQAYSFRYFSLAREQTDL